MSAAGAALRRLHDLAKNAGHRLLDTIYPPGCLICRRAIAEQGGLCPACWREIAFIERPFCERLGVPFDRDLGQSGLISLEAAANPPVFARARAVARFDSDGARALAYRLKYRDRLELAEPIGRWMTRAGAELLAEADLIAPVPLHRRRLIARQFNQSAALAKVIARESGVPQDLFALQRVKATTPQVGLSRVQRAANLAGAFKVSPERAATVRDRRIVLVDDVLTTGATANAAARALLRAGAAQVDLLVFARAVTSA